MLHFENYLELEVVLRTRNKPGVSWSVFVTLLPTTRWNESGFARIDGLLLVPSEPRAREQMEFV